MRLADISVACDEKKGNFDLTDHGRQKVRCSNPPCGPDSHATDKLHEHIERALRARYRLRRDQEGARWCMRIHAEASSKHS